MLPTRAWALRLLRAGLAVVVLIMCAVAPATQTDLPVQERSSLMAGAELESPQPEITPPGPWCHASNGVACGRPARGTASAPVWPESPATAPPLRPPQA